MLIKKRPDIKYAEITPKKFYLNRRQFIAGSTAVAAFTLIKPLLSQEINSEIQRNSKEIQEAPQVTSPAEEKGVKRPSVAKRGEFTLPDEKITSYEDATGYVNFYEFSTSKRGVEKLTENFRTRPWSVAAEGLVKAPKSFDIEELIQIFPLEERIYRWRCVETWSMVIPWIGFPLGEFIKRCEPTSQAKFVEFTTLYAPEQMPGQQSNILKWPYVEGLRMDEAMHPLTILAVGMYDEFLPPQNGAPLRLVVPWKYGFKSIKSIVKVRFVEKMPTSAWMRANPAEYGFYANVNPFVTHPRWSQEHERRIGEQGRRKTTIFNGYGDEVSSLYAGLNLKRYY